MVYTCGRPEKFYDINEKLLMMEKLKHECLSNIFIRDYLWWYINNYKKDYLENEGKWISN